MRLLPYGEPEAKRLVPLLNSIGAEILERQLALRQLEDRPPSVNDNAACAMWKADLAVERRELRRAYEELERLGCSLVGRRPLTFRIPRLAEDGCKSFLWQEGELIAY